MNINKIVTFTVLTFLLCLSASAWMTKPDLAPSSGFGALDVDLNPNDPCTNGCVPASPPPTSGMFVTAYSTNDPACAAMVTSGVNATSTNIGFNGLELINDPPSQTPITDGQYIFALFPSNYVANVTNTPAFVVSAWSTFTNIDGGVTNVFTLTNSITVSLLASQGVYTAYFTDTNLNDPYPYDWTNGYCAPVETIESQYSGTNYTSPGKWYMTPSNGNPVYVFLVIAHPSFLNPLTGTFDPGWIEASYGVDGTPGSTWQPFPVDVTGQTDIIFSAPDNPIPPPQITLPNTGRASSSFNWTNPPAVSAGLKAELVE